MQVLVYKGFFQVPTCPVSLLTFHPSVVCSLELGVAVRDPLDMKDELRQSVCFEAKWFVGMARKGIF